MVSILALSVVRYEFSLLWGQAKNYMKLVYAASPVVLRSKNKDWLVSESDNVTVWSGMYP